MSRNATPDNGYPCPQCGKRTRSIKTFGMNGKGYVRYRKCSNGCRSFRTIEHSLSDEVKPATIRKRIQASRLTASLKGLSPKRRGLIWTIIQSWQEEDNQAPLPPEKGPAE